MHYVLFDHSDDLKLAITNSTMVEIYFLQSFKSSKCIKIMFVSVEVLEKQFSNWKLMIICDDPADRFTDSSSTHGLTVTIATILNQIQLIRKDY